MIKSTQDHLNEEINFYLKILNKTKDGRFVLESGDEDQVKSCLIDLYTRLRKEQHQSWIRGFRPIRTTMAVGERVVGPDGIEYITLACGALVPVYDALWDDLASMLLANQKREQRFTGPTV